MATYRVWSGASGAANGSSWPDACLTLTAALALATSNGDEVRVHRTHQEELAADANWTPSALISIFVVDKDNADALAEMGTDGWVGSSTSARVVQVVSTRYLYVRGLTIRNAGTANFRMSLCSGDGAHIRYQRCYFWLGTTNSTCNLWLCAPGTAGQSVVEFEDCTFRLGNAAQKLCVGGFVEMYRCGMASAGAAPTTLFAVTDPVGANVAANVLAVGCDWGTGVSSTATLVGNSNVGTGRFLLVNCRVPSSPTYLGVQTGRNRASAEIELRDCAAGDTHLAAVYANPFGTLTTDTSITFNGSAYSWKIVTTADVGPNRPFFSPWIAVYNEALSAITPRFEVLRDASATAYYSDELWAEFVAKTNAGFVTHSEADDGAGPRAAGAAQANGAGLGSWAGESGTAWSGQIDSGAAITPAEIGDILGRVAFQLPSSTVYVHPQILTA